MKIVHLAEIRQAVSLDSAVLDTIEDGFNRLARGGVQTPPIMRIDVPQHHGEVDVKAAYVDGIPEFAIKISSGFFDNPAHGLPSGSGMMIVLSALTGQPQAVLLDEGYLTDVRTAAAGALAAQYLAPPHPHTVGIIGSGAQARWQLRALRLVRDFEEVFVFSTHADRAAAYAQEMERELSVPVRVEEDPQSVVRVSDVVVTTTPATQPVIQSAWVHPGQHITAMGSDAEDKHELDPGVLAAADIVCCDLISQCQRLGELHHAIDKRVMTTDGVVELGQLTSGLVPGRMNPHQVTVADLTGTGVQDTMIAGYALSRLDIG